MDDMLKQILQELKRLNDGQGWLESNMARIESRVDQLESRLERVAADLSEVKTELLSVKPLGEATFQQTGLLTEFRTEMDHFRQETNQRLDRIEGKLDQHGKVIERLSFRFYRAGSRYRGHQASEIGAPLACLNRSKQAKAKARVAGAAGQRLLRLLPHRLRRSARIPKGLLELS
ncbi:MAG: hypothetical protein ACOX2K_05460 [Bacillota bacterium]|jgi:chromosome segregation ATPase